MVGRTNAFVGSMVSSVNGMTGAVILNANIIYDPEAEYDNGTIGAVLQEGVPGGGAVQSVNGMTGNVVLNANIAFDPQGEYDIETIGEALQNVISDEDIDALYGEAI